MTLSLERKMELANGNTSGFDYLRIGLSLAVVFWHCYAVWNFDESNRIFWAGPWRALPAAILPMFFALSGFLVTGSLLRTRVHHFAVLRILRIIPALSFETVLVALFLGPVFTALPLSIYFSSPEFYSYFFNIIGYIHYTLPGVFDGRMLNAQLWTVPTEFECYVALILLALTALTRRRSMFAAGLILGAFAMTLFSVGSGIQSPYAQLGGKILIFSFLAGVLLYLYRNAIKHSVQLMIVSLVLCAVLLTYRETSYLAAFPAAYVTVWLGLTSPPKIPFGDLSYGVFLFHFPIIQATYQIIGDALGYFQCLMVVLPLSLICAFLSWIFVEQPILARKKQIISRLDYIVSFYLPLLLKRRRPIS